MQLSMRTDYALRALFTLVEHYGGQPIPIAELARRNDVPKRFLEHIMLDLKERSWVTSTAGKRGGMFSRAVRNESRWAKSSGTSTAIWRRSPAFPSRTTNAAPRNPSAAFAA